MNKTFIVSSVWHTYCELVQTAALLLQFKRTKLDVLTIFFQTENLKGRQLEQLSDFMLLKPFRPRRNSAVLFTGEMKCLIMSFYNHFNHRVISVQTASIKWPRFLAGLVPIDTLLYFCTISQLCGLGYCLQLKTSTHTLTLTMNLFNFIKTLLPDKCITLPWNKDDVDLCIIIRPSSGLYR